MMRAIDRVVAAERPDVIHGTEWVRTLEAVPTHVVRGVPLVSMVQSIHLSKLIPRSAHLVVAAAGLADLARDRGYRQVDLIEPPTNPPRPVPPEELAAFRAAHELDEDLPVVLVACRLANEKIESVEMAIDAVAAIDDRCPAQLVVAGEGPAADALRSRADAVNARLGRRAVRLTGLLLDVAPAYAAADVIVGMGTSVRRGMALGKAGILVGQGGFAELMDADHGPGIAVAGFWGMGDAYGDYRALAEHLCDALSSPDRLAELGRQGAALEADRPTFEGAVDELERVYFDAVAHPPRPSTRAASAARAFGRFTAMRSRAAIVRRVRVTRARA
jgi:glycosyltransferase involved in cell wall biosynthesis